MKKLFAFLLVIALGGCSASVSGSRSTAKPSTTSSETAQSTTGPSATATPADALQEHLATIFASMFQDNDSSDEPVDPQKLGMCVARETIRLQGGAAGLRRFGVTATSTASDVNDWIDSMLEDRVHGRHPERFDAYVDALWACGMDKSFSSEFRAQLKADGNSSEATDCLVNKVIGDRYLRLVLIIGNEKGSTPDAQVQKNFADPLIAAVDTAASACGVTSWGGS